MLSSRPITTFATLVVLVVSLLGGHRVRGQGVTTITDESGETLTTSMTPTVYSTNGQAYTFVPSTPATPTPSIRSLGSIQNLRDYMASRSEKGVAGSAPPVTATAVVADGGRVHNNKVVQANDSAQCRRTPPRLFGRGGVGVGLGLVVLVIVCTM